MEKVSPILLFCYSGRLVNVKMKRNIYRGISRAEIFFALIDLLSRQSLASRLFDKIDIAIVFTATTTHFLARSLSRLIRPSLPCDSRWEKVFIWDVKLSVARFSSHILPLMLLLNWTNMTAKSRKFLQRIAVGESGLETLSEWDSRQSLWYFIERSISQDPSSLSSFDFIL